MRYADANDVVDVDDVDDGDGFINSDKFDKFQVPVVCFLADTPYLFDWDVGLL